ncbi:hypothetical protein [Tumebacillus lipolyticus]|uniref:YqzM family protein n=1 Tax=Tumebacillus lipolyticus TaxID=1280370 RepID=A0ABW5A1P7_9BACL
MANFGNPNPVTDNNAKQRGLMDVLLAPLFVVGVGIGLIAIFKLTIGH